MKSYKVHILIILNIALPIIIIPLPIKNKGKNAIKTYTKAIKVVAPNMDSPQITGVEVDIINVYKIVYKHYKLVSALPRKPKKLLDISLNYPKIEKQSLKMAI